MKELVNFIFHIINLLHFDNKLAFCQVTQIRQTMLYLLQILDVNNGEILGVNKEGELWLRGPQLSLGYLNLPAQTRELLPGDGWMRTGKPLN